jgi:hypothetical protein
MKTLISVRNMFGSFQNLLCLYTSYTRFDSNTVSRLWIVEEFRGQSSTSMNIR